MPITLTFEQVDPQELQNGSWPLRVSASSDIEGLDSSIFVYHAQNALQTTPGDICEAVASIIQMNEIPIDEPGNIDGVIIPYYRKDSAEFHFHTSEALEEGIEIIKEDVKSLIKQHEMFDRISETQVEVIS
jgi:hypothetical protein